MISRSNILGPTHPETLYCNALLVSVQRIAGKLNAASLLSKQTLSIIETQLREEQLDYNLAIDLHVLYASCVEEYGRILFAKKEYDAACLSIRHAVGFIELALRDATKKDYCVHLALLQSLLAEIYFTTQKYEEAINAIEKANACLEEVPDNLRLRYYLLNQWHGKAHAKINNHLLSSKVYAKMLKFEEAETSLENAWQIAALNKGINSIECCNAYAEILRYYGDAVPKRVSLEEFNDLFDQAIDVTKATDKKLRLLDGIDKYTLFPYVPLILLGTNILKKYPQYNQKSITLLLEILNNNTYSASLSDNDLFKSICTICKLLCDEKQFKDALYILTQYKPKFSDLVSDNPECGMQFYKLWVDVIFNYLNESSDVIPYGPISSIPSDKVNSLSSEINEAIEAMQMAISFYDEQKNDIASFECSKKLVILSILSNHLDEALSESYRALKRIDRPTFAEYTDRVDISTTIQTKSFSFAWDFLILRGSILKAKNEPLRALNHYKAAMKLLIYRRDVFTTSTSIKIKDGVTRSSIILNCLDLMLELESAPQLSDQQNFFKTCKDQHPVVVKELNRLHARYLKKC